MKRTTASGHASNLYTEGNPGLGIAATVVGAAEMNNIQEELCNIVEEAGITLDGSTMDQAITAIKAIIKRGGDGVEISVVNNQAAAANVTGVLFDKTAVKSGRCLFDVHRRTDSAQADEMGELYFWHNPVADTWSVDVQSRFGTGSGSGLTFSITAAGQVQYVTDNMAGASYSGTLRINDIKTILQ
jgi:hypothetical protein